MSNENQFTAEDERALDSLSFDTLTLAEGDRGFCDCWPCAKKVLLFMKDRINKPVVKRVINLLIRLGDRHCPNVD